MFSSSPSCLCASGEDLVPEQTSQREEDYQEKAAAFPAGLNDDPDSTSDGGTLRCPRGPQSQQQYAVRHQIWGILDGFVKTEQFLIM